MEKPEVVSLDLFELELLIPRSMSREEVLKYANTNMPCGTKEGWKFKGYRNKNRKPPKGFINIIMEV